MNRVMKPLLASIAVGLFVGGCTLTPHSEKLKYAPMQKATVALKPVHKQTYVREVTPEESDFNQTVSLVGAVALIDAIRLKLPNISIIPQDSNIDLTQMINVSARNMYVRDFLEYLSSLSGYQISLVDGKIEVSSFVRKEWNLAMFSSKRDVKLKVGRTFDSSTDGIDGKEKDNTIKSTFDDDEWDIVVEGAKRILNVVKKPKKGEEDKLLPYVQAVRSVGAIHAGGTPQRMEAVDDFVTAIAKSGTKQVNISVKAYDVVLKDNRGVGVDWKQLTLNKAINGNPLELAYKTLSNNVTDGNNTLFQTGANFQSKDVTAEVFMNFLSQFGEVELLNQPNVTVRNGAYAYLATGDELAYVGEIEKVRREDEDIITRSIEHVRVGVTLAVTPRILKDERILLDIWPVVTSVVRFDSFASDSENFEVPQIALQELSTQVIAESGKPIQLGGFIRRSIAKSLEELPWGEKMTGTIVKSIFGSENQDLERRELVLTVTSTIVEEG